MKTVCSTTLNAGLKKPVKILHITDVHLAEYDRRNPEEQLLRMEERRKELEAESGLAPGSQNGLFEEAFRRAEEEGALLVLTGDTLELCTEAAIEECQRITAGKDFMFTPGSHEFTHVCRRPDEHYRTQYATNRKKMEEAFPHWNFTFESRVVGGVNLITADNNQGWFAPEILEKLKTEAEKGLPMVLFMHVPLFDKGLLVPTTNPHAAGTEEDYRINREIIDFIGSCPLILATFAGHWHKDMEETAPCGVKVYVTPALYTGGCRIIEIR